MNLENEQILYREEPCSYYLVNKIRRNGNLAQPSVWFEIYYVSFNLN